jgi:hypothetical protein
MGCISRHWFARLRAKPRSQQPPCVGDRIDVLHPGSCSAESVGGVIPSRYQGMSIQRSLK